uniref:Neprosin PEP catalytic domain-containing protein n=1 Tax=Oryza barthii TaxID=65489 RepID=A0A0D3G3R3_9ORYZ
MSSTLMASCCFIISYKRPRPIIATFVPFLLLLFFFAVVVAASSSSNGTAAALHPGEELLRLERVRAQLARSPDGDVIDCVPSHLQPAFEHPRLRGQKPEHAVGYMSGGQFYGAKASLNVWPAKVASPAEFSLSQIWLISGSFGNDLNTIEAGWQVSPQLYGDNNPRFFTYWTNDAYQETGCYNLHCSGFVQTNSRIAMGAAISPISSFAGRQFDITLLIWKDPKQGHWWLQLGSGALVGYWPSFLFSHLGARADMAQFGGEVVNTRPSGSHTPTQMGSGRFQGAAWGRFLCD